MKKEKYEECENCCPKCGFNDLKLKDFIITTNFLFPILNLKLIKKGLNGVELGYYPFICNNCGLKGKEYFVIKYEATGYK